MTNEIRNKIKVTMTISDIVQYRLMNQQIAETKFKKAQEIVGWFGAMQAQEFAMAKWAIGLRLPGSTDADIEKTFNDGLILRTHLLRPTWHFVTPMDIRWILALTSPRVNAVSAYYYRKMELDMATFKRSNDTLAKTLQGGKHLARGELKSALERKKIIADGLRFGLLLMRAELDGVICSGVRLGKQFTYALLDERVPPARQVDREEALAQLARRYFTSRGPATVHDFVWWSGLAIKDAKAGIGMLPSKFVHKIIDGKEYVFIPLSDKNKGQKGVQSVRPGLRASNFTFLLPDYDEYGISYKDRSAYNSSQGSKETSKEIGERNAAYNHIIVVNGVFGGTWKRTTKNKTIDVETVPLNSLTKIEHRALIEAKKKYISFFGGGEES